MRDPKPYIRSISLTEGFDPGAFPFSIPAVANLYDLDFHQDVTFFVGENGSGKSTVLEAIAIAMGFGAQGGTKNVRLDDPGDISELHNFLRVRKSYEYPKDGYFLRAESFYNVATYMDEVGYLVGYGGKSLHKRSHGESFMAVLFKKLKGKGLYLLDEPEAALSPSRQLIALTRIHELVKKKSQFIIATHSPIILAYPHSKIILFDNDGWREISYEETEHFSVTADFLNNYKRKHELLLGAEDE